MATENCTRHRHHTRRKELTRPPVNDTPRLITLKQKAEEASMMKPSHRCQKVGRGERARAAVMTGVTGVRGEVGMRISWCCNAFSLLMLIEGLFTYRRTRPLASTTWSSSSLSSSTGEEAEEVDEVDGFRSRWRGEKREGGEDSSS